MTEPGKSDRWNSLLETLGVPIAEPKPAAKTQAAEPEHAAPAPARQPPRAMLPERAKATPKPKVGPPAAKSPSYWSRIAGALGLEVTPEPEPAPPPPESPVVPRPEAA